MLRISGRRIVKETFIRYPKKSRKGENNPAWKGGKHITEGYYYIWKPEHQFANSKGYVAEHRLVWEEHNKASLLSWAIVHHKNEKRQDNRPENLEAMMMPKHRGIHNTIEKTMDMSKRYCLLCLITFEELRKANKKRHYWLRVVEGYICEKCCQHIRYFNK